MLSAARLRDVWSDIWPQFGPIVERVIGGEALAFDDLPILMMRNGYPEDTWFSFSYTPLHDEDGRIAGLFCACNETTGKVRGEHALREVRRNGARARAPGRAVPAAAGGRQFHRRERHSLLCNPAFEAYVPDCRSLGTEHAGGAVDRVRRPRAAA